MEVECPRVCLEKRKVCHKASVVSQSLSHSFLLSPDFADDANWRRSARREKSFATSVFTPELSAESSWCH